LPGTWRVGLAPHAVILPGPPTTSDAAGFATDGDGDGIADVWDPADAVASTARLLAADGAAANLPRAIWSYNHSWTYVQQVLALARGYEATATLAIPSGPVAAVLAFARSQLGVPYVWGGASPGGWDCSGLVMAAFAQAGLRLPHNAELQYEATMADPVPLPAVEPGDLVFFGSSVASIGHVGIVIGGGEMIDAPHTGAVVRVEPYTWPDLLVATRPLAALGP
ncbi:MAG: C40 family peptidase, partial [Acidimicrobiales bacterium]